MLIYNVQSYLSGQQVLRSPVALANSLGMINIADDPDYSNVYDDLPQEEAGDSETAEERRFFMSHADDLSMEMTVFQKSVQQHQNLFLLDTDWSISSIVQMTEDKVDRSGYQRLNTRLQLHEIMLQKCLCRQAETRKNIYLLKLVSFLVPLLIAMRKRMKIPELTTRLLPSLSGELVRLCLYKHTIFVPFSEQCLIGNFFKVIFT